MIRNTAENIAVALAAFSTLLIVTGVASAFLLSGGLGLAILAGCAVMSLVLTFAAIVQFAWSGMIPPARRRRIRR